MISFPDWSSAELAAGEAYRARIRARPPLPFDPSMIDELPVILRSRRLERILTWHEAGVFTPDQLNALLAEWWSSIERPSALAKGRLTRAFKFAGFVTDTEGVMPPTTPLTLFRGAGVNYSRGHAWTTDERVAAWFARRLLGLSPESSPRLYTTLIAPAHVLGIFHHRDEAEVVINPFALRGRLSWRSGVRATDERVIRLAEECSAMRRAKKTP
jgi:hypothetical protein